MANMFNLKSVFTADTKDLKKGAAEAKQAVKDFDNATTDALNEITGLFNTSMGDIGKTLSAIRGGLLKFSAALNTTSKEASFTTKAMKLLKVALVSTGVGALVVALGSLVAYLTKTQRGADWLSRVMGQVGQVFKTTTDYAILLGEKIFNAFKNPVNAAKEFWKIFTNKEERQKLAESLKNIGKDFEDRQKRRLELDKRQQAYRDKEAQFEVDQAKRQAEINELRLKADDRLNYSEQQRLEFISQAQALMKQQAAEATAMAQERLDMLREENALSESMTADTAAEKEIEKEIVGIQAALNTQLKETVTKQAEITNQIKAQAAAAEKAAAAQLVARKKEDLTLEKIDSSKILDKPFEVKAPKVPKEEFKKIESFLLDTTDIVNEFSNTLTDAFAAMVEGLVSGELNMKDIFNTVLMFLAENLKAIGKALIAYGMAMEGFKKAFSNPWAAIAAGAALVAAGAVLTGLIKKASAGDTSSSPANSYAAATATVGGGGTLDLTQQTKLTSQTQEVRVTGTIKASGRDLAIILENEEKRKSYIS